MITLELINSPLMKNFTPKKSLHTCFISGFLLLNTTSFSQNEVLKVVSIQQPITYSLNAATSIFGKSKTSVRVSLPNYTIAWFYIASVSKGSETSTSLFTQLSKLVGLNGLTGSLISEIVVPKGDAKANFYVVNEKNSDLFLTNKRFEYYREGAAESSSEARMDIRSLVSGLQYIAIDNPTFSPIKVTIEVVAVLKEPAKKYGSFKEIRTDWQGQNAANVVNILKKKIDRHLLPDQSKIIGTENAVDELKECVIDKIIANYKFDEFLKQASGTIDYEIMLNYKACVPNFYYQQSADEKSATIYGNLGWKAFEKGEIDNCIQYSKKSLEITPLFFVKANLALCYLKKGMEVEAVQNYMESIDIVKGNKYPKPTKRAFINAAIQDIENERKNDSLSGADDAISILRSIAKDY